jgi:hypothetical protein
MLSVPVLLSAIVIGAISGMMCMIGLLFGSAVVASGCQRISDHGIQIEPTSMN